MYEEFKAILESCQEEIMKLAGQIRAMGNCKKERDNGVEQLY